MSCQVWKKLGLVFCPETQPTHPSWMRSHASNVVIEPVEGDILRAYFSTRDEQNRSHVAFVDFELAPPYSGPFRIVRISERPVLAPGDVGLFDDSGASLSCIRQIAGKKHMFYLGWNLGVTVPWRNSIGLAILDDKTDKFEKTSRAPLLDRCDVDPYSISYPFVLEDHGLYRMWYGSNLKWGKNQEDMAHLIKYAESRDGIHWKREGRISLEFNDTSEYAMSRPYVIQEGGLYRMWYSYRGKSYRIGYAESKDGISFTRMDEQAGIDVSGSGWDSEMLEYPFVFEHHGRHFMAYNGNSYGKTGFGIAIASD